MITCQTPYFYNSRETTALRLPWELLGIERKRA